MMYGKNNLFHKIRLEHIFSLLINNNITCYLVFCTHYFLRIIVCFFVHIYTNLSCPTYINIFCTI